MYFVKEDPIESERRIRALLAYKFMPEAFLAASYSIEKTLHRTLRQLVISSGFSSTQADQLLSNLAGPRQLSESWACFDPTHAGLDKILDAATLQSIEKAREMREKVVRGMAQFSESEYQALTETLVDCQIKIRKCFQKRYDYDGWSRMKARRKSKLHVDPYVKMQGKAT